MRDVVGPNLYNSFLQELFFQRLPSHVPMVLALSGDDVSLDTLADMADKIMEVAIPTLTSVTSPATPVALPPPATTSSEVAELQAVISELRQLISLLQLSSHHTSRSSSRPLGLLPHPTPGTLLVPSPLWVQGPAVHIPLFSVGKWPGLVLLVTLWDYHLVAYFSSRTGPATCASLWTQVPR